MAFRTQVRKILEGTIGVAHTDRIRDIEARARRRAVELLDPGFNPADRPAATAAASTPADGTGPASSASAGLGHPQKQVNETAKRVEPRRSRFGPPDPYADFPRPPMSRHSLLRFLHESLQPRTYLETGVSNGRSLALSRSKSIGIDPAFRVNRELRCDVQLVRAASDDFFAGTDALAHFDGVPIDLAFIDGMHLAEFALRDFMNIEKYMAPTGVVVIDDMLPRNNLEAARNRRTGAWTGDVFKLITILAEQRPELTLVPLNTAPTGTLVVLGVDPTSTALAEAYQQNLERCQAPDPQMVPSPIQHRSIASDPAEVTDSAIWKSLADLRDRDADRVSVARAIDLHLGAARRRLDDALVECGPE